MLKCILKEMKAKAKRDASEAVKFMGFVALVIMVIAVFISTLYVATKVGELCDPTIGLLAMLVMVSVELGFAALTAYLYCSYKASKAVCLSRAQGNP